MRKEKIFAGTLYGLILSSILFTVGCGDDVPDVPHQEIDGLTVTHPVVDDQQYRCFQVGYTGYASLWCERL